MVDVPEALLAGGEETIAGLRTQISDEVRQRRQAEKKLATLTSRSRSVLLAQRERDLAETPELRQAQARLDQLVERLVGAYESFAHTREMAHVLEKATDGALDVPRFPGYERTQQAIRACSEFYERPEIRARLRPSTVEGE